MSVFQIDEDTFDLLRDNGRFVRIDEVEEVAQRILIHFGTQRGEYFYIPAYGVPYLQEIISKNPTLSKGTISAIFVRELLNIPEVRSMLSPLGYSFDEATQTLTMTATVDTDYGPIERNLI
jgi:hypothetical protein